MHRKRSERQTRARYYTCQFFISSSLSYYTITTVCIILWLTKLYLGDLSNFRIAIITSKRKGMSQKKELLGDHIHLRQELLSKVTHHMVGEAPELPNKAENNQKDIQRYLRRDFLKKRILIIGKWW